MPSSAPSRSSSGPTAWRARCGEGRDDRVDRHYAVPAGTDPVAISVQVSGRTASVAFGDGHAVSTTVALGKHGTRVRFAFPGLPSNLCSTGP